MGRSPIENRTLEEERTIAERRMMLAGMIREIDPCIEDLAEAVGYTQDASKDIDGLLHVLDDFLRLNDFRHAPEADRIWYITNIGYFITKYIISKHGGRLVVQDCRRDDYFMHFVIGGYEDDTDHGVLIDPFAVANYIVRCSPKYTVKRIIESLPLGSGTRSGGR